MALPFNEEEFLRLVSGAAPAPSAPVVEPALAQYVQGIDRSRDPTAQDELRAALSADREGQRKADAASLIMQAGQSFANQRQAPREARIVDDRMKEFLLGRQIAGQDAAAAAKADETQWNRGMDVAGLRLKGDAITSAAQRAAEERAAREAAAREEREFRAGESDKDRQNRLEAARLAAANAQAPKPAQTLAAQKDLEDDVQKLGNDLEAVGQMKEDLAALDAAVAKGIPGFGPVAGYVPDVVASDDAIKTRQAAKRLMAAIIQMRSGTAASDREVDRLLTANGLGPTATGTAFKEGVTALRAQALETIRRKEAKYRPEVKDTYHDRGGVSVGDFDAKPKAAPEDLQAKAWAEANPGDPRAAKIMERLKAKGL